MPRQCAHWLAMTCRRQKGVCGCKDAVRKVRGNMPGVSGCKALVRNDTSPPVIARSEATWQSVLLRQHEMKSNTLGEYEKCYEFALSITDWQSFSARTRIAAPVCALVRNDMQKAVTCQRLQGRGAQCHAEGRSASAVARTWCARCAETCRVSAVARTLSGSTPAVPRYCADRRQVFACHCEERSDVAIRNSCGSTNRKAILPGEYGKAANLP